MYEKLKREMKEILAIVGQCPTPETKVKCLEVLLNNFISEYGITPSLERKEKAVKGKSEGPEVHVKFKAFMKKHDLDIGQIHKLFLIEPETIESTYRIETKVKSEAQMQIALLEATKNAIRSGEFKVEPETIRENCITSDCYDPPNFASNFKKNKSLFKAIAKKKPLELSAFGHSKLAEIVKEFSRSEGE